MKYFRSPWMGFVVAPLMMIFIFYRGSLYDSPTKVFEPPPPVEFLKKNKTIFIEKSEALGVHFKHQMWFPNPQVKIATLPMLSIYPSSNVVDINQDGWMDIALTSPHPDSHPQIFQNDHGQRFIDVSKKYGFDQLNIVPGTSRLLFDDLDLDGKLDMIVTKYGCHEIYWGQGVDRPFVKDKNPFSGYCSNANSVNLVDINHDGLQDIVFVNYWLDKDLYQFLPLTPNLASNRQTQPGGRSVLFINQGNRRFQKTNLLDVLPVNYSNNVGVADLNRDGYLDLYFANDYSYDRLLMNKEGKILSDETEERMPLNYHGLNGMNADFADFNRSGNLSLYVGNITNPPFISYNNVLWEKNDDFTYRDTSRDRGVAHCGWTWSGKWSDFDNDGQLDLVVSNGRARGINSRVEEKMSLWHSRTLAAGVPRFLRILDPTIDYVMTTRHYLSSYERNCLFKQEDGQFYDIAEAAGLRDLEDGYGLSLVDFNNDGKMDFIISNMNAAPTFYVNESVLESNRWIGFSLSNLLGNRMPLGARLKLVLKNEKPIYFDYYPTNGFNSQSDPRVHFGLGPVAEVEYLEVIWPNSQTVEKFSHLRNNTYQEIKQGAGEKN